jgi:hypothetical protein
MIRPVTSETWGKECMLLKWLIRDMEDFGSRDVDEMIILK